MGLTKLLKVTVLFVAGSDSTMEPNWISLPLLNELSLLCHSLKAEAPLRVPVSLMVAAMKPNVADEFKLKRPMA